MLRNQSFNMSMDIRSHNSFIKELPLPPRPPDSHTLHGHVSEEEDTEAEEEEEDPNISLELLSNNIFNLLNSLEDMTKMKDPRGITLKAELNMNKSVLKSWMSKHDTSKPMVKGTSIYFNHLESVWKKLKGYQERLIKSRLSVRGSNNLKMEDNEEMLIEIREGLSKLRSVIHHYWPIKVATKLQNHNNSHYFGNFTPFHHNNRYSKLLTNRKSIFLELSLTLNRRDKALKQLQINYNKVMELEGVEMVKVGGYCMRIKRFYNRFVVWEYFNKINLEDMLPIKMLLNEASMLFQVKESSHFPRIYGVRTGPSLTGMLIEHSPFGSLKEFILAHDMPNEFKSVFSISIINGIRYLHSLNVVHCNLTLDNIFIYKGFQPKLLGLNYAHEIGKPTIEPTTYMPLERMKFMPPEILMSSSNSPSSRITSSSDIFSLGLILFSIWSGFEPLDYIDSLEVAKTFILNGGRENALLVEETLREDINACWRADPKKRIDSSVLLDHIETLTSLKIDDNETFNCTFKMGELDSTLKEGDDIYEGKGIRMSFNTTTQTQSKPYTTKSHISYIEESIPFPPRDPHSLCRTYSREVQMAHKLYKLGHKKIGFDLILHLSKLGDIEALYHIGYYHYYGIENFLEVDIKKALDYFEITAASNYTKAFNFLALHYLRLAKKKSSGDGVVYYYKKAFQGFKKGSELGDSISDYHLAGCYIKGNGVEKDLELGIKYLKDSAMKGNKLAREALKRLGY